MRGGTDQPLPSIILQASPHTTPRPRLIQLSSQFPVWLNPQCWRRAEPCPRLSLSASPTSTQHQPLLAKVSYGVLFYNKIVSVFQWSRTHASRYALRPSLTGDRKRGVTHRSSLLTRNFPDTLLSCHLVCVLCLNIGIQWVYICFLLYRFKHKNMRL